jgi:hypothetical protein
MGAPGTELDPPPSKRQYFRSAETGDLGYLVQRKGKDYIKLDRALEEIVKPYNEATRHQWQPDREWRPLNRVALAQICFEADKVFCRHLGLADLSTKEWLSLSTEQRILWMEKGPTQDPNRAKLWKSIVKSMEHLVT